MDDIDRLTIDEYRGLEHMYAQGLWGANKDYLLSYIQVAPQFGKDAPSMAELFPDYVEYASFGQSTQPKPQNNMNRQAVNAMMSIGGAPKHIVDALDKHEDNPLGS